MIEIDKRILFASDGLIVKKLCICSPPVLIVYVLIAIVQNNMTLRDLQLDRKCLFRRYVRFKWLPVHQDKSGVSGFQGFKG